MKVVDLMTKKVVTVGLDVRVNDVAEILHQFHFTGVPVVTPENKLVGLIAERDFIASQSKLYLPTYIKLLSEMDYIHNDNKQLPDSVKQVMNAKAADIMNTNLITATIDMDIQEVAQIFAEKRVNPIPVIDNDGSLVGIISRSDLIKLFSEKNL